jgi:hypothetical protein
MSKLGLVGEVEEAKRAIESCMEKYRERLSLPQCEHEFESTLGLIDLAVILSSKIPCSIDSSADIEYEFEERTSIGPFEIELFSFTEKRVAKCDTSLGEQRLVVELRGREVRVKKNDSMKQVRTVESWTVYEPT